MEMTLRALRPAQLMNGFQFPASRTNIRARILNLRRGKYKIKVFTSPEDLEGTNYADGEEWRSNEFFYDTENPAKVIFVSPTVNQNGFYDGGWKITARAPKFFQFTKPAQTK